MSQPMAPGHRDLTWFGQPRGLTILFLTEMWEQFSYYGMRALLVYYMTRQLMMGQERASLTYGTYTAIAYFTPIFGGMLADRRLGKRRAVVIGGTIMAIGHFLMAFPPLLYIALATIALGNGLFLPSLPSQINDLYGPHDPRRGRAYNIYYVGVNIGGFLAPLICGTLGEFYGWHWGFAAAGVGMLLGLTIYVLGGKYLPEAKAQAPGGESHSCAVGSAAVGAQGSCKPTRHAGTFLVLAAVGVAVTIFRGAYEQVGNTVALWADIGIDRHTSAAVIPMTWFQSLNPLLVFLLTPLLLARWRRRAEQGTEASAMRKMALGAFIVALAYSLLAMVSALAGAERASWIWLVVFFVIFTLGELYILPTGLGLFARLAPTGFAATTVAAWFLAIFTGSLTAGAVGTLWSSMPHAEFFVILALLALAAAGMLLTMDRATCRIEAARANESATTRLADAPGQ
ncbi:MAG: peptide MFS transporter [Steroidobacteraceae bacterium]